MRNNNLTLIIGGTIMVIVSIILGAVATVQLDTAMTAADPVEVEAHTGIVTGNLTPAGGSLTTANVTLTDTLWDALVANVSAISSNVSANDTGTLVASSYDSATQKLLVSGLGANTTRTLTVSFYNMTTTFDGLYSVMGIYGVLIWVAITGAGLAMLGFGTYGLIKSRSRPNRASRRRVARR